MAERVRRERRQRRPDVKAAVEVDEVEDFEDDVEPEPVKPAKPVQQRRDKVATGKRVVVKAAEPVEEEFEDEEPEEVVAPEPKRRVAKAQPVVEPEEEDEDAVVENPLSFFEVGKTYQLTVQENGTYLVTVYEGSTTPAAPKRGGIGVTGKAFFEEVYTDEFKEWQEEWQAMSATDKEKAVRKAKVTWEEHDHGPTNHMRMTAAYVDKLGIERYKPEYRTRKARAELRGK